MVLGAGSMEGPLSNGEGVAWRPWQMRGGALEPSKQAVGGRGALSGPPPPSLLFPPSSLRSPLSPLSHSQPQRRNSSCSKASCPSLRQVLAESSLPPSLGELLHPLSSRRLVLSQQPPLPLLQIGRASCRERVSSPV